MKLNIFQIVILGVFAVVAVSGLLFFAAGGSNSGGILSSVGSVQIWGTFDKKVMDPVLTRVKTRRKDFNDVRYTYKDPATLESEFVEALASGRAPDLILLPQDLILKHRDKVLTIPYNTYSARTFRDTFVEGTELFLFDDGFKGVPFSIDPLVMYWNRDILSTEGIATPPRYWDEFFGLSEKLTKKDFSANISRSTVAFGEYRNVSNAKEIISILMMQAGTPIVRMSAGIPQSVLAEQFRFPMKPAEAALLFYTAFSNPVKSVYSWNRSLPSSRQMFLSGDLVFYFGFASELPGLRAGNPNLNFDVGFLPQTRDAEKKMTYGGMTAFAIARTTQNSAGAFAAAAELSGKESLAMFTAATGLPPVRRDLLTIKPTDAYQSVLYDSALVARAWLDPNPAETSDIFQRLIESITSGRARVTDGVASANSELSRLLK